MPGAPRPGVCVLPSRAGLLMRGRPDTDETRFWESGSLSRTTCLSPDAMDSPWRAPEATEGRGPGTSQQTFRKAKRFRGQMLFGTCRQTSLTHQHQISRNHDNGLLTKTQWNSPKQQQQASSSTEASQETEPTGSQVTQHWRFILK